MRRIYLIAFIVASMFGYSQENNLQEAFNRGNEYYSKELYDSAVVEYTKVVKNGYYSFEVYFNLGNSYYKLGDITRAKLYYEKAKVLDNQDEELERNLQIINSLLIDKIEVIPDTFITKVLNIILGIMNYNNWGYLAIILSVCSLIFFILYRKSEHENRQRLYFVLFLFAVSISVIATFGGMREKDRFLNQKEGIIITSNVYIKGEPRDNADDIFILHEGTKARILLVNDGWCKIKISDGKIGWLKVEYIEEI